MAGPYPRDHLQPSSRSYRSRSPLTATHDNFGSRSRSPRRPITQVYDYSNPSLFTFSSVRDPSCDRAISRNSSPAPSTHSYDFNPPSLSSSRQPSYDNLRDSASPRSPSIHTSRRSRRSDASSSHAHRDSDGYYYGSSEWSSNHGNHSPRPSVPSTTTSQYSQRQREAPHLYGDDKLPQYSTASQHARSPLLPPSYTSSRDSQSRLGSMPPPSFRSFSTHGGGEPRQNPPTRGPSHFYPDAVPARNYYIDKWRRG